MIKIDNVTKVYNNLDKATEVVALSNVSMEIKSGEFVGIVGRSGCGKSTLLNIIGGLDKPTTGKVSFEDIIVSGLSECKSAEFRNNNIGFIFQAFYLDKYLTVLENITMPLLLRGVVKKDRNKQGLEILEKFGIQDKAKLFPNLLSGGEMQRVAIARALITNPKLILADEPTGNLDSSNGKIVINTLSELAKEGTTVILITHNVEDVKACGRVIGLEDGVIILDNHADEAEQQKEAVDENS